MEKPARYKAKSKKPAAKPKTAKKRKSDGPTCSMFLAELTRKLASKKKQEEESPKNIVQTIIDSITNALPVKLSRKSPQKCPSPMKIETLQTLAPELIPNDSLNFPAPATTASNIEDASMDYLEILSPPRPGSFKMPKMPLINSDELKASAEKKRKAQTQDQSVNTGTDHDVASEIAKHVGTLRKISLIAEEFNQKTAKNLKEIVDSVQEDLIKKLEEIRAQQKLHSERTLHISEDQSIVEDDDTTGD
ncbi:uncharacterized protein LOC118282300 isoform X1 [Spodoptera frugiperda]|uniref:Uncharacterized protein LOC118262116 isoform X1 n=1 Tax=Spodoptera frugiperda TaxID=7108 RepID=A0A9R0EZT1_SPOFR|nr:uncharacterized protein LOC118262116 isoform X1 [Spodoptera frugiperda]XP_035459208.2 uncharacterized protein LOC118282300 isoform X1 [Spodoptera frugiperda]XP_050557327.1 uncharacterized protein LOC118262116 isoform X1 [Spodoptera frugiperda]XP_050557328.1 uncharacterized protein LOC118262116 isoform X1 [Spodoptera frugiperda]XP_050557329.1 uncharacterized protein LOC118262116 isoform X1 [Spodoptera frugiperda]XP_050557431.1 uncharacterized protein LOC118282300 isoform X1 [Spodoptera frugi